MKGKIKEILHSDKTKNDNYDYNLQNYGAWSKDQAQESMG
jgi:hypothetical protein